MLTTDGLHSVVKEECVVASEASKCLKRKLQNALYAKWSAGDHLDHIFLALTFGDIIWLITNVQCVYWSNTTIFIGRI